MKSKTATTEKRKLNLLGLISFLSIFLLPPLLLIPWYRLFVLRSNTITTLVIHVIGMFVIGIFMIVLGILAVMISRKRKGELKSNWMGIVGLVLGIVLAGFSGFLIVDYLIRGAG